MGAATNVFRHLFTNFRNFVPDLAALVRRRLIRPERPQITGEDGFRFTHLLVRDAAYDALPKATRAGLHERFAAPSTGRNRCLLR